MPTARTTFRTLILCAAVIGAATAAGPDPASAASHMKSERHGGEAHTEAGTTDTQELRREWQEAIDALGSYSANQRDKAVERAESLMERMDARIARLERQMDEEWSSMSENARKERQEALQSLRRQRQQVAEWYGGMKHGSSDAWSEVRKGFSDAYGTLIDSFGRAADAFRSNDDGKS